MKIRLSTLNAPLFNEGGLGLRENQWTEFETQDMTPEQLDLVEAYTGRIVQFAPEDDLLERFAEAHGLQVVDGGKFSYALPADMAAELPALGTRHKVLAATATAPGKTKPTKKPRGSEIEPGTETK